MDMRKCTSSLISGMCKWTWGQAIVSYGANSYGVFFLPPGSPYSLFMTVMSLSTLRNIGWFHSNAITMATYYWQHSILATLYDVNVRETGGDQFFRDFSLSTIDIYWCLQFVTFISFNTTIMCAYSERAKWLMIHKTRHVERP